MKLNLSKFASKRAAKFIFKSVFLILAFCLFWFSLPSSLFNNPVSTVLEDRHGQLLGALIADDGQWRFPYNKEVPAKFKKAVIQFEDKRFYHHPGIDLLAMGRAFWHNIRSSKIKSGGSTITMQVIRLSRKGKSRTLWEKLIELFMAIRLECSYSKNEIMALYSSNAPFGSNVVGLDAAAWRYFGRSSEQLSWGEMASLAVLPNSPSLVYPGKNHERLRQKRNWLLQKLFQAGDIDSMTCSLSKAEPLPGKPFSLPQYAPHLLARSYLETGSSQLNTNLKHQSPNTKRQTSNVRTTIDKDLQSQVNNIVSRHHEELKVNGINNAAALVVDVETGDVLAYAGNIYKPDELDFESHVDIITSPRSTGSILKPFLFSAMLNEGELLPNTLIPDIPTQIAGYSPQNFNRDYDGAVPAKRALERSLNVPAVRMLRSYGIDKFNDLLKKMGMTTLSRPADHYGLSIILGGAEGTLWDIAGMYASMARTLNHFGQNSGKYNKDDFHPLHYVLEPKAQGPALTPNTKRPTQNSKLQAANFLSAASIWCTFNAMEEVSRPEIESNWRQFSSSQRVAWKTGTSFGFRDGWAVGCTPKYIVAVWTGNADGEGRPGLTGIATAAPIMFDIIKLMKPSAWFEQPYDEMEKITVCHQSGHRALEICESTDSMWIPLQGLRTSPCPYHQIIHLDATGKWRVSSDCESPSHMIHRPWFVLPPAQEWFYKSRNQQYTVLPAYRKDCTGLNKSPMMEFIYPKKSTEIYVPVELDGTLGKTIFEVAHRMSGSIIYWHLDDDYIGYTKDLHQMGLSPDPGKHLITLVDDHGERLEMYIEILSKKKY